MSTFVTSARRLCSPPPDECPAGRVSTQLTSAQCMCNPAPDECLAPGRVLKNHTLHGKSFEELEKNARGGSEYTRKNSGRHNVSDLESGAAERTEEPMEVTKVSDWFGEIPADGTKEGGGHVECSSPQRNEMADGVATSTNAVQYDEPSPKAMADARRGGGACTGILAHTQIPLRGELPRGRLSHA